jgi:2-methoxy-6-polyprenyl-1,4-benzoquinol methylase
MSMRNVRLAQNLARSARPAMQVRAISNAAVSAAPLGASPASSSSATASSSSASSSADTRTTHFGFQTIPEEEKETLGGY